MLTGTGLCSYESSAHFPPCPLLQLYIQISGKKGKKKKNLGQVVHPLPWGPIPAGQTATSFSPLFPPIAMCRPHFLCSYEILLCSELINSSRCLLSHQPLHRNSLHKEGGLKTFSRGAAGSCLPQLGLSGGIWLTKCQKLE